jgi:hypothetical protein
MMKQLIRVYLTAAAAAMAFAAVPQLPEGEGKKILESQCTTCHSVETAVGPRLDRDAWKKLLTKMIGYGATLDDKQIDITAEYLSKHFGPEGAGVSEEDRTAEKHIMGICSTCHDSDLIRTTTATRDEWLEIVKKMNSKGAGLSDTDVDLLTDYLARKYRPK